MKLFKKVKNIYISYILNQWLRDLNTDFTLGSCVFGSVKLTKSYNLDKYKYSGYSIGFDSRLKFSFTDESMEKNVFSFGAAMSSSVHIDYKNKDILILNKGATQGLFDTTLTAEAKYHFIFIHHNGSNSFLFLNATKIYQFKAKDLEIKNYKLCLGNISKDFAINNMKRTALKGSVQFFSVDFDPIDTDDILDIHRYLIKGT